MRFIPRGAMSVTGMGRGFIGLFQPPVPVEPDNRQAKKNDENNSQRGGFFLRHFIVLSLDWRGLV